MASKLELDTDDVQALQWYFEHKLYEVHGVGEKARDYEEAANKVVQGKNDGTGNKVDALSFLRALEGEKSFVQPRGNEGPNKTTSKTGKDAQTRALFEGDKGNK